MREKILKQYDNQSSLYKLFGDECLRLILELLNDEKIRVHQITTRVKSKDKLNKKIELKNDKYSELFDITDICGVRIITYLESDVDSIATIIEKEFEIDRDNSIDKRKLKTNEFGYKSLHYVVSLNSDRYKLSENKKYEKLKCEIQIRSILQHAWAEIEHDLGYKGEIAIPEEFRRTFSRIAAQLETADVEFDRLKKSLANYEKTVQQQIVNQPNEVKLDQASIISFLNTNNILIDAKGLILNNSGIIYLENAIVSIDFILSILQYLNIYTIGQLNMILENNRIHYLAFVVEFTKSMSNMKIAKTVPLYYFGHFLISQNENKQEIMRYLAENGIGGDIEEVADEFLEAFRESKP